jgi:hypothetical protein
MRSVGDDQGLYAAECTLLAVAVLAWTVFLVVRWLGRSRPGLGIGRPSAVAGGVRLAVAAAFSSSSALAPFAVPDEKGFVEQATTLAHSPFGSAWTPHQGDTLVRVMGLQIKVLGNAGEFSLRVVQITIAVVGLCLLSAAVYDLAGPRAAQITAWLLAIEPTNAFFSEQLHREALVLLAEGLVALGAVRMRNRRDPLAAALMAAGVAVAVGARQYAAMVLLAGAVVVTFYAALRRTPDKDFRSVKLALASGAVILGAIVFAIVDSDRIVARLNSYQAGFLQSSANLNLKPVRYSSLLDAARDLPSRAADLALRPYPWQVANVNQRLGTLGTTVAWGLLLLFVALLAANLRTARLRAPPLLIMAIAVAVGYSFSTQNAGTGFRYRTHVIFFLAALIGVLAASHMSWLEQRRRTRGDQLPA